MIKEDLLKSSNPSNKQMFVRKIITTDQQETLYTCFVSANGYDVEEQRYYNSYDKMLTFVFSYTIQNNIKLRMEI